MKKISKKIFGLLLVIATFVSILPSNVLADTTDITLTFNVGSGEDVIYTKHNTELSGTAPASDNENKTESFIGFKNAGTNDDATIVSVDCDSSTSCTVVVRVESGTGIDVQLGGDSKFVFDGNTNNIIGNSTLTAVMRGEEQNPGEDPGEHHFDGKTYLIWSCGNGTCYHKFTDMDQENSGVFINASTITADNNPSEKFNVHAKVRIFADDERFEEWISQNGGNSINWSTVNPEQLVGPDGVDYQPVGEPGANNAFVSYADRNFKAIVYNSDYRGVTIGSLVGLKYYPSAWTNQLIRTDSVDISGTSASKPAEIDTVLLEDTINIAPLNINGLNISSIEAIDVPSNAVKITKNNDGSFKFKFASRFYNHVVFKITGNDGKSYFLKINRQTIYTEFMHGLGDDRNFTGLVSDFYYDRNTTYTDYKITAKIMYKNGKTKIVEMSNAKFIDDGLGNSANIFENDEQEPSKQEWPVGKGLKRATYKYSMTEAEAKTVSKIYINVEFKGSTNTNYAGMLAGSGMGELVSLPNFR